MVDLAEVAEEEVAVVEVAAGAAAADFDVFKF